MKSVSKAFESIVYGNGNKNYLGKATITLANGTELPIENSDIWDGGIQVIDKSSSSGNFDIGFCSCNELVLKINNISGKYSSYNFNDAIIRPYTGLQIEDIEEYVKHGVFTVDLPESVGSYISLSCMDNMHKLDEYIETLTGNTAGVLVNSICIACGVSLKNAGFDGNNRELTVPVNITEMTYRQALGFICQAIGTFAKFDGDGLLEIKWYDTGAFETGDNLDGGVFDNTTMPSYQTGDNADGGNFTFSETTNYDGGTFLDMKRYHHVYSMQNLTVATDDVVITGIKVTNEEVSVLFGTEEYALSISDNPFIVGRESEVVNYLGQRIVGMRFRPLSVTGRSNVLIEAGDPIKVSDRKKNVYQCFATSVNFTIGKNMQFNCDAATPKANSAEGLSAKTEIIMQARKNTRQEITFYDLAVQQLTSLIANGLGVFKSEELDENGGTIYYTHDKPTMTESTIRWYMNSGGSVEEKKVNGVWTVVSGTDNEGNALYNVLTARGINAEWIKVLTYFTVGNFFSVDHLGRLIATNAKINGEVTAESGNIAGMGITSNGLVKETTTSTDTFIGEINMNDGRVNISFNNLDNSKGCGYNAYLDQDGRPLLNMYARDENDLNDANIFINGVPVLTMLKTLRTEVTNITNFLIEHVGYEP